MYIELRCGLGWLSTLAFGATNHVNKVRQLTWQSEFLTFGLALCVLWMFFNQLFHISSQEDQQVENRFFFL